MLLKQGLKHAVTDRPNQFVYCLHTQDRDFLLQQMSLFLARAFLCLFLLLSSLSNCFVWQRVTHLQSNFILGGTSHYRAAQADRGGDEEEAEEEGEVDGDAFLNISHSELAFSLAD